MIVDVVAHRRGIANVPPSRRRHLRWSLAIAAAIWILAVGANKPMAYEHDVAYLLDGVKAVAVPGVPGPLCVYGPDAFPVIAGATGNTRAPVAVAARWHAGRIVALGHDGYLKRATLQLADTDRFLRNALQWTTRGNASPRVGVVSTTTGAARMNAWLAEAGYDTVGIALTPMDLASVDVAVVRAWNQTESEVAAVGEFVRAGGGLVTASTGWGWAQLHPQRELIEDFAGNRLLAPVGIQWVNDYLWPTAPSGFAAETPPDPLTHALPALKAVEPRGEGGRVVSESGIGQAIATLERAARCVPNGDELLKPHLRAVVEPDVSERHWPTADDPVGKGDATARLAATLYVIEHERSLPEDVRPHSAAADFPGSVPDDAPRIGRRLSIDTAVPRWHSTGLYAAPGELVTVKIPAYVARSGALHVRVGAHTDGIWPRDEWERMPEISRRFPVLDATTHVANAFGGLIYVEVEDELNWEAVVIEIEGAVAAPRFVLGETEPAAWLSEIRHAPGPWAEIEGRNIILTTPSHEVRRLDDPATVAETWDRVLDLSAELAAWNTSRKSPERFVLDRQTSHGYMHSGYPLMAHLDQRSRLVDSVHIGTCNYEPTQSNWGFFHEVGHTHQNPDWTFSGTVEVTVNLFTLYVHEFLCGITVAQNWRGTPAFQAEQMARYNFDEPNFEQWKRDPFLALVMYEQMQQAFGWEAFRQVFAEYRNLSNAERPKNDDQKRDQWLVRFSRTVGRNLGPFFQAWGVPTSQGARDKVAGLPIWMPDGFPPTDR